MPHEIYGHSHIGSESPGKYYHEGPSLYLQVLTGKDCACPSSCKDEFSPILPLHLFFLLICHNYYQLLSLS